MWSVGILKMIQKKQEALELNTQHCIDKQETEHDSPKVSKTNKISGKWI